MKRYRKCGFERIREDATECADALENCLETLMDGRKGKMVKAGTLFGLGKSLLKLGWHGGSCVVKHTPRAVVAVARYKRELVEVVTEEVAKTQKEMREEALERRIEALSRKVRQ